MAEDPSLVPSEPAPRRQVRPLRTWTIFAGALAVVVATGGAVWWLQDAVPAVGAELERAKLRVETIRTGLSIGAALGAALALLLAFRRQQLAERDHLLSDQGRQLAERAQQATEHDAAERRITELYVKAADQLGSDKAPVRLAGLYALERLAQDNPEHRQTIVDVICAYLRMPYHPPRRDFNPDLSPEPRPKDSGDVESEDPMSARQEERQVRLAAQRILARHLRVGGDSEASSVCWGALEVDLAEAVLIDVRFFGCDFMRATFRNAVFIGRTRFDGTRFHETAWFPGACFMSDALFSGVVFMNRSAFDSTVFGGDADFPNVEFAESVTFFKAQFASLTRFDDVSFNGRRAHFGQAHFAGTTQFTRVTLSEPSVIDFTKATVEVNDQPFSVWPPGWRVDRERRMLIKTEDR
ncbi:pentapeptide repeat-containing protein [Plantactinospora sp. WMMB782]|uniref:pentapeptide repeat-containing protein n=1 Tax=Plantactinospora sp. WMMB782 TaxID=3404121 RepID=UPI003B94FFAA